jgi:hypothetical protein
MTALENRPTIAVVRGVDVSPAQYPEILAILVQNWRNADPYLDDFSTVMRNAAADMLVRVSDGQIDGVLRTTRIYSHGDPHRIPQSFEELVGPYWSRRDRRADTRILVDLTKRDGASGVARSLIGASLEAFREPHIATFSPEDRAALHVHFGAYPVGRIEHGRPRHASPHVILMRYRGFAGYPHGRLAHDLAA